MGLVQERLLKVFSEFFAGFQFGQRDLPRNAVKSEASKKYEQGSPAFALGIMEGLHFRDFLRDEIPDIEHPLAPDPEFVRMLRGDR